MAGTADDVMEVCVVLFVVAHITKLGVVILMWAARKYCASSTPLCEEPLQWKHKQQNATVLVFQQAIQKSFTYSGYCTYNWSMLCTNYFYRGGVKSRISVAL